MKRIVGAAVAAALTVVLGGCSAYEDLTTSEFAKQEPDKILESASKAMREVDSVRIIGRVRDAGLQMFLDIRIDRSGRCTGGLRYDGRRLQVLSNGSKTWFKGDAGFFAMVSGYQPPSAARDRLSRSWLLMKPADGKDFCDLVEFLEAFDTVDVGGSEDSDTNDEQGKKGKKGKKKNDEGTNSVQELDQFPMTVDEESDLDGTTVVKLSASPGGSHDETVWVASDAPHRVLKVESSASRDGGSLTFSAFNEPVEVEPPAAKDVFKP